MGQRVQLRLSEGVCASLDKAIVPCLIVRGRMNSTMKVQFSLRQAGRRQAYTMWHGSRFYGDVDLIF